MSNLHRGHSIDDACHVSVNLAKLFQRRLNKMANQKQELPVEGRLEMDHNKMCTLQRGPSIDASY